MKTFIQFENDLLDGVSVSCANGKGFVVHFYPCYRSCNRSLISVCVEFCVLIGADNDRLHTSSSLVSLVEAYEVFLTLSKMA